MHVHICSIFIVCVCALMHVLCVCVSIASAEPWRSSLDPIPYMRYQQQQHPEQLEVIMEAGDTVFVVSMYVSMCMRVSSQPG